MAGKENDLVETPHTDTRGCPSFPIDRLEARPASLCQKPTRIAYEMKLVQESQNGQREKVPPLIPNDNQPA